MGKGKLQKFEEIKSFSHVIQEPYHKINQEEFYLKGKWAEDFFRNKNPLVLELGCGKGEYSVGLAEKNQHLNFIGVDIKGARLWKGAKVVEEKKLKNVAFLRTNIEIISRFFAENEVDEIWLTFPDPQMKKTRKRLTATNFLEEYSKFLKKDGIIHLKTDSNFQFTYTRELIRLNNLELIAETESLYDSKLLNDTLKIKTFYEKQWLDRGIPIKYLAFKLNKKKLVEPEIEIERDEYRSFGRTAKNYDIG